MEQEFITAGQVVNSHGVRGEVKILPQGLDPFLLTDCETLYIDGKPFYLIHGRVHKGCLLARLEDVNDMNAAQALKGKTVTVRKDDLELPIGEYLDGELLGLTARNAATGEVLGTLEEVMHYPAHDIYLIQMGKKEYLIPAVSEFIAGVDLEAGTMDIHMMEGLGPDES